MNDPPPVLLSNGQPCECTTSPGLCLDGSTCHSSFKPLPYFCGSTPSRKLKRPISSCDSEPRQPSANSVYFASSSIPGWYSCLCSPPRATPMSPVATPRTLPSS